ncbi:MAG: TRAP transporter substrate-binding protein [Rhodospirillaceae bacterium]|nr:TRAP transporter substrate-binding protein [Rhodospirillaceae bacterium]
MRKFLIATVTGAITATASAVPAAAEIKVALDAPPDPKLVGTYVWSKAFADHLGKAGFKVKLYKRGALGGEAERLDQIRQGLLEISNSDVKSAGTLDTLAFGAYLPYLFKDAAHFDRALDQASILDRINAKTKPKGVIVLAYAHLGPPAGIFNTKRPIATVADLKDLRMRALDKSQIALYDAWGAKGTIVAWKEVPNALQTGVAHGYLNPVFVPVIFGHTNFIKYFTDAKLIPTTRLSIASAKWYDGLKDREKSAVDAAVAHATKTNRNWVNTASPEMNKLAESKGIRITQLSPAARAEFVKASKKVYTDGVLSPAQLKIWTDAAAAAK